ncbi:ParA family protein (plasmid) [Apilactobacillus apisilvae]|uniref:ParA family protein n=1 Tax=Apilactobacillus apisilvae TaxID=2923364 RepID=A0ABY4PJ05_9LACO|nr:ParA family protein [Apilactobacillus apisilvae]UQS85803.1 ParA family protein [Apilactobacillus apisilvae]
MNDKIKDTIGKLKERNKALTITVGNQKGGVGKTSNATLIGYMLAKKGVKTLVADLDPQSNATKALMLTKSNNTEHVSTIDKTLMAGVQEGSLSNLPVNIVNNLDLLPSFIDFKDFAKFVYRNTQTDSEVDHYLEPLFEPLKENYDIILIDVPPMNPEVTNNSVVMSDYVLISLQTQERSLTGAEDYLNELANLKDEYSLNVDVLGILEVLMRKKGSVDNFIIKNAKEEFGQDNIFENVIPQMERIKRFDVNGISEVDFYDKKVIGVYNQVTDEFLNRIHYFEYE